MPDMPIGRGRAAEGGLMNPKVFEACVLMLVPIALIIWFLRRKS